MTVNAVPGSGYNFFERDQLTTAIHEASHAGGSEDYLNENGPVHSWDNAHTIENIANNGLKDALRALQMPTECKCE